MYVKDSETEIRKRCVRKIWLMWYIMAIFIFIGHIMLELIWETDKWSEIYKHTSLTHNTTNDVCLQNNELKRKNISSIFTVAAMRGIFIIKTFLYNFDKVDISPSVNRITFKGLSKSYSWNCLEIFITALKIHSTFNYNLCSKQEFIFIAFFYCLFPLEYVFTNSFWLIL